MSFMFNSNIFNVNHVLLMSDVFPLECSQFARPSATLGSFGQWISCRLLPVSLSSHSCLFSCQTHSLETRHRHTPIFQQRVACTLHSAASTQVSRCKLWWSFYRIFFICHLLCNHDEERSIRSWDHDGRFAETPFLYPCARWPSVIVRNKKRKNNVYFLRKGILGGLQDVAARVQIEKHSGQSMRAQSVCIFLVSVLNLHAVVPTCCVDRMHVLWSITLSAHTNLQLHVLIRDWTTRPVWGRRGTEIWPNEERQLMHFWSCVGYMAKWFGKHQTDSLFMSPLEGTHVAVPSWPVVLLSWKMVLHSS